MMADEIVILSHRHWRDGLLFAFSAGYGACQNGQEDWAEEYADNHEEGGPYPIREPQRTNGPRTLDMMIDQNLTRPGFAREWVRLLNRRIELLEGLLTRTLPEIHLDTPAAEALYEESEKVLAGGLAYVADELLP